jgi:3-oxoacyl-(acyl-carrier-protein) synthase
MSINIVVTGMGVISPYGVGSELLWEKLIQGKNAIRVITSFDTSHIQCRVGGQLTDFRSEDYLPLRMLRKIDRFSAFGLIAVHMALKDAGLLLDNQRPVWSEQENGGNRVGITVGNNLGGWEFAERELFNLWKKGPRDVSPYMATAWFPAAVQGNVSIQFGIKGIGRTFLSDRASSAHALMHAADCLRRGKADIMIAGGTEAPFAPYAALCYQTSGLMSEQDANTKEPTYRPFDQNHDGLVAAEGAAFFVLEREEDAKRRGVPILAKILGWSSTHDGYDAIRANPDGKRYAASITQTLQRASLKPSEVDCIFAAGSAVPDEDLSETRAIHLALGGDASHIPVTAPKSAFGNLFGAAFALDMAIAISAMQRQIIPVTLHLNQPAEGCDLEYVARHPRQGERLDHCLLNARGIGGVNASMLIQHPF